MSRIPVSQPKKRGYDEKDNSQNRWLGRGGRELKEKKCNLEVLLTKTSMSSTILTVVIDEVAT